MHIEPRNKDREHPHLSEITAHVVQTIRNQFAGARHLEDFEQLARTSVWQFLQENPDATESLCTRVAVSNVLDEIRRLRRQSREDIGCDQLDDETHAKADAIQYGLPPKDGWLHCRASAETVDRVDALAKMQGVSRSDIIRTAADTMFLQMEDDLRKAARS